MAVEARDMNELAQRLIGLVQNMKCEEAKQELQRCLKLTSQTTRSQLARAICAAALGEEDQIDSSMALFDVYEVKHVAEEIARIFSRLGYISESALILNYLSSTLDSLRQKQRLLHSCEYKKVKQKLQYLLEDSTPTTSINTTEAMQTILRNQYRDVEETIESILGYCGFSPESSWQLASALCYLEQFGAPLNDITISLNRLGNFKYLFYGNIQDTFISLCEFCERWLNKICSERVNPLNTTYRRSMEEYDRVLRLLMERFKAKGDFILALLIAKRRYNLHKNGLILTHYHKSETIQHDLDLEPIHVRFNATFPDFLSISVELDSLLDVCILSDQIEEVKKYLQLRISTLYMRGGDFYEVFCDLVDSAHSSPNYKMALNYLQRILLILQEYDINGFYRLRILHHIAETYRIQGALIDAKQAYKEYLAELFALRINRRNMKNPWKYRPWELQFAEGLNELGKIYIYMHDYDFASRYLRFSLCRIQDFELGDTLLLSVLNSLLDIAIDSANYNEAKEYIKKLESLLPYNDSCVSNKFYSYIRYLQLKSHYYYKIERVHAALPLLRLALIRLEEAKDKRFAAYGLDIHVVAVLNSLAFLYAKIGRYAEAEPLYQRSLQINEDCGAAPQSIADTLDEIAGLYKDMRRDGEAEPLYQRSLQLSEDAEALMPSSSLEWWRAEYRSRIVAYIDCLLRNGKPDSALEVAEKFRCEELIAQLKLQDHPQNHFSGEEQAEYEEQRLRIRWLLSKLGDTGLESESQTRLLEVPAAEQTEQDPRQRKALQQELSELARQRRELELKYMPHFVREQLEIEQLRGALAKGQAALEYCVLRDGLALLILTADQCSAIRIEIDGAELKELLRLTREIVSGRPEYGTSLDTASREVLSRLYELLILPAKPLLCRPDSKLNLVIVPSGELANIPWAALIAGTSQQQPVYLADEAVIRVIPSLQILAHTRQLKSAQSPVQLSRVLCIADPVCHAPRIPESGEEAKDVAELADVVFAPHLRKDALKRYLLEEAEGCEVVHLSTHGSFNDALPEESRIVFSPSDPQLAAELVARQVTSLTRGERGCLADETTDDDLNVRDAFQLPLKDTKLLTLSACQVGQVRSGELEQFQGMVAAVVAAGCPNTIAALWSVDDAATRHLMVQFYTLLKAAAKDGRPASVADTLREASLNLRDSGGLGPLSPGPYSHPYFWAPFQVYGCG